MKRNKGISLFAAAAVCVLFSACGTAVRTEQTSAAGEASTAGVITTAERTATEALHTETPDAETNVPCAAGEFPVLADETPVSMETNRPDTSKYKLTRMTGADLHSSAVTTRIS